MKSKLIIAAGFYRSGSTWQFNALRVICELHFGKDNVYSCFSDHYSPETRAEPIHIVKIHKWNEELARQADLVFTTHRNMEDVKGSMKRRAAYLSEHPDSRF